MLAPCLAMSIGLTLCLPVTSIPPGATIVELLALSKASSIMTVPSILEDISLHADGTKALLPLQFVAFGGGLLNPTVGEKLDKAGVKLLNHFGATEVGAIAPVWPVEKSDYDYRFFRLRRDFNFKLIPQEATKSDQKTFNLVACPFEWGKPFEINDQLICNLRKPSVEFGVLGRTDDMIALDTGEKVLPNIMEAFIRESELCKTAIVVGQGQFEVGILIEPSRIVGINEQEDLKTKIWKTIHEANEKVDTHAQVSSKNAIILVAHDKHIPRSDKGSVMRQEVYKLFEAEISQMYKILEDFSAGTHDAGISLDLGNLESGIEGLIQDHLNWKIPAEDWDYDGYLFELGMDSLQALQLRRLLLTSLLGPDSKSLSENISRDFVYFNPTVLKIAMAIREGEVGNVEDQIESLVAEYSSPLTTKETPCDSLQGDVILLTSSAGSLGSHILEHLVNMPRVSRVVCLNRAKTTQNPEEVDIDKRQRATLEARGITLSASAWCKVELLQANLASPHLGLKESKYLELTKQVTHIIHNAWPMDFNMRVRSFTPQFVMLPFPPPTIQGLSFHSACNQSTISVCSSRR